MVGARRRMRRGEVRHGHAVGEQGGSCGEGSGQDRSQMAAAVRGMDERVQQVDALFLRARRVGVVMGIQRLSMIGAATAEFVQVTHRGEDRVHQHRKHEQRQRGQAQHSDHALAEEMDHRTGMLREGLPVKQLQR